MLSNAEMPDPGASLEIFDYYNFKIHLFEREVLQAMLQGFC